MEDTETIFKEGNKVNGDLHTNVFCEQTEDIKEVQLAVHTGVLVIRYENKCRVWQKMNKSRKDGITRNRCDLKEDLVSTRK